MTTISNTAPTTPAPALVPRAGGGIRGYLGDMVRAAGVGYSAVTDSTATEADRAAIVPFEGVTSLTSALRDATQNVRGVGRATSLLHMGAGFGMLIAASNVSNGLRAPGDTMIDLTHRAADLLDGRESAPGWSLGWGMRQPTAPQAAQRSAESQALADLGIG